MNFDYEIFKVNDHEHSVNVRYTCNHPDCTPRIQKIYYSADDLANMTEEAFDARLEELIILAAPTASWEEEPTLKAKKQTIQDRFVGRKDVTAEKRQQVMSKYTPENTATKNTVVL